MEHELLYRFVFPERPGALMKFLDTFCPCWNITLFHYRSQVLVICITHRFRFLITYGYYTKYIISGGVNLLLWILSSGLVPLDRCESS